VEAYQLLKKLITECEDDVQKAVGGNKAAQTRVRKTMQEIKNAAQQVREGMLTLRDTQEQKEGA
jgi:predicted  nucleic acid-binding Zn-ribbon protein